MGEGRPLITCTYLVWCDAMREALNPGDGKGLCLLFGIPEGEQSPRKLGVAYRRSARDQGFVLNVCPWCRAKINFWRRNDKEAARG